MESDLSLHLKRDSEFTLYFNSSLLGLKEDIAMPITLYKDSEIRAFDIKPKIGKDNSIVIRLSPDVAKNVNLKDFIQVFPRMDFN